MREATLDRHKLDLMRMINDLPDQELMTMLSRGTTLGARMFALCALCLRDALDELGAIKLELSVVERLLTDQLVSAHEPERAKKQELPQ